MSIGAVWAVDVVIAAASWAVIWIGRETTWLNVSEPAVVGLAMSVIGIATLVGFYNGISDATDTRMRSAIAAGFSATYIYLITSLLVIADFADSLGGLATDILDNFTVMVTTILGFYFGSRAIENVNAAVQARKLNEATIARGGTATVTPTALHE